MRHILSYFSAPITNKKPSGEVDLCEIHKYITTNEQLREATATVRAAYEATNMEQYKRGKLTMLPSVTPAGVFREAVLPWKKLTHKRSRRWVHTLNNGRSI
jgi:hypothetical protein